MAESYQLLKRTGNRIKYKQETMLVKSRETSRTLKKKLRNSKLVQREMQKFMIGDR